MEYITKLRTAFAPRESSYHQANGMVRALQTITLMRFLDKDFLVSKSSRVLLCSHEINAFIILGAITVNAIQRRSNVDVVVSSALCVLSVMEIFYKLNRLIYLRKSIARMLELVLNDRTHLQGTMEEMVCQKYHRLARKLVWYTIIQYMLAGASIVVFPGHLHELDRKEPPLGITLPFVDNNQLSWYLVNYIMQSIVIFIIALMFAGLDGPFYIFIAYSAAQLEILINYSQCIGECSNSEEDNRRIIRKIFGVHTRLSSFLGKCSDLYRTIYLVQVVSSVLLICVALFHVQYNPSRSHSYGLVCTSVFKMWMFCYTGQLIVSKADEFNIAVTANRWYALGNRRDLRDVLFLQLNAQRHYGFSIGGFGYLCFETFTKIMKTAYSFYAFLQQVMD
ncbi:uncharacterized protein LOC126577412 [Anopheles aquasalis]|uniref:uncharacterized protein LOC126577412 n=1 Tax=Anopheles aquasalis TaxID=42839 RepID=UPI00215AAEFA|nr:uncharacterized protein LOC126577412 [Anopheles aquasalis]